MSNPAFTTTVSTVIASLTLALALSGCGFGVVGLGVASQSDGGSEQDPDLFVTGITPQNADLAVRRSSSISVSFSTLVDPATVNATSFQVHAIQNEVPVPVPGTLQASAGSGGTGIVRFTADDRWPINREIEVSLSTDLATATGKRLPTSFLSDFRVRDGGWAGPSPVASGVCLEVELLGDDRLLALIYQAASDTLEVLEMDLDTGIWISSGPIVQAPVSCIRRLSEFSHTFLVSQDSLITSTGGRAFLICSARTPGTGVVGGAQFEIQALERQSEGQWSVPEVLTGPTPVPLEMVESTFRAEEPNVAWLEVAAISRRQEAGSWQAAEVFGPSPVGAALDIEGSDDGSLHVIWEGEFDLLFRCKQPGATAWSFTVGVPPLFRPLRNISLHAFDDGGLMAISTGTSFFELASSAYKFPASGWAELGSTVILNPGLIIDGAYVNTQVASQGSGQMAVVLAGDAEGFGTIGANTFSPIAWDQAEVLAPQIQLGATCIGEYQVAAGVDMERNSIAVYADPLAGTMQYARFEVELGWSDVMSLTGPAGGTCPTHPRLSTSGSTGEGFLLVTYPCLGTDQVQLFMFE